MNQRIDIDSLRSRLTDRFPQWTNWISRVPIEDAPTLWPTDNDGRTVFYNPRLMSYVTEDIQAFYLAQQLLHLRFSHTARGKERNRAAWKRASDAVVNRLLRDDGFQLPMDATLIPASEGRSAEELYEIILATMEPNLPPAAPKPEEEESREAEAKGSKAGKHSDGGHRGIDDPGLAKAVAGLSSLLEPCLQLDYDWFPGEVVRDGMLPYQFRAVPVANAEILLDTSASVDTDLLRAFVRGVKALFQENAVIRVGCFDTRFYGFHEIHNEHDIDSLDLRGAGGTNFTVAVNAFTGDAENQIIFTDGYAEMPEQSCDAVWVVYGDSPIHPKGGRVLYAKPPEEKEKYEINFQIT